MSIYDKYGSEYAVRREAAAPGQVVFHVSFSGRPVARALVKVARCSVSDVVVFDTADRRKGIASALYNHIEADLGFTLVPNRLRLADGKAFWKSRQTPQRRALGTMAPRHVKRPA